MTWFSSRVIIITSGLWPPWAKQFWPCYICLYKLICRLQFQYDGHGCNHNQASSVAVPQPPPWWGGPKASNTPREQEAPTRGYPKNPDVLSGLWWLGCGKLLWGDRVPPLQDVLYPVLHARTLSQMSGCEPVHDQPHHTCTVPELSSAQMYQCRHGPTRWGKSIHSAFSWIFALEIWLSSSLWCTLGLCTPPDLCIEGTMCWWNTWKCPPFKHSLVSLYVGLVAWLYLISVHLITLNDLICLRPES